MSLNIDLYKERLDAYKVSGKDGKVDSIKKSIIDSFYDNPAYFEVLINDVPTDVHILPKKDSKSQNKLLCKPDELIKIGDFVEWEDEMYICVNDENDNSIQYVGYITKCNNILTFQTPDTTIHTIPCILTDRASIYSDGVEDTKYISLPDGLIKIVVPNNDITNTFDLLNKRIIFDHSKDSVFKITKAGRLLKKGLIETIAEVTNYNHNTDNLELNISNYIEPDDSTPPEQPENPFTGNYTMQISGQSSISVITTNATYIAKVYDSGIEVDAEVEFEISDTTLATIKSQDDNSCVVVANPNFKLGEFKLKAILVEDESVFTEKSIMVTGL